MAPNVMGHNLSGRPENGQQSPFFAKRGRLALTSVTISSAAGNAATTYGFSASVQHHRVERHFNHEACSSERDNLAVNDVQTVALAPFPPWEHPSAPPYMSRLEPRKASGDPLNTIGNRD